MLRMYVRGTISYLKHELINVRNANENMVHHMHKFCNDTNTNTNKLDFIVKAFTSSK